MNNYEYIFGAPINGSDHGDKLSIRPVEVTMELRPAAPFRIVRFVECTAFHYILY